MNLEKFYQSNQLELTIERSATNDGFLSPTQALQFAERLAAHPNIQTIAEIGFNAGHSAQLFFSQCKQLKLFVTFDLCLYECTKLAQKHFSETYPDRFVFVPGDSLLTIPHFCRSFSQSQFDLIYIDGCHLFEWALNDIVHCKRMAHSNTLLWIDDVEKALSTPVAAAVKFCESIGLIEIEQAFISEDPIFGKRRWLEARYL